MKKQRCPMCGKRKWRYKSAPFKKNFLQKIIKYFLVLLLSPILMIVNIGANAIVAAIVNIRP